MKQPGADRTSKMRMPRETDGRAAPAARFLWPAPPYYELMDPQTQPSEECLLLFKDGEKATGLLLDFLPGEELLKFHQARAQSVATIAFSALLGAHLLRPVAVRRQSVAAAQDGEVFAASDRQSFSVRLVNGTSLEGETVGHVSALCGLFLFLPEPDGTVIRCFVPAQATVESRIGEPMAEPRVDADPASAGATGDEEAQIDDALVQRVNKIVLDAVEQRASDIHIESNPGSRPLRVRFRKDGVLVSYQELPSRFRGAIVSRLKSMSGLDTTERHRPQEGKIDSRRFGPIDVDLRVASIPTAGGLEDIVISVLACAEAMPFDRLGFDRDAIAAIKRLVDRPRGLFLVCGPTGSGKTTTLHSILAHLNTSELKIWTAEDPIEIVQPGLRQVQMSPKIGWNFAAAMRSFMRADPDVIMVGGMRDAETAKLGIEASLTGRLVLSTLHTGSAPESVVRLLDLGMDPFNFADALLGVLAQRLVRKLCGQCKLKFEPSAAEVEELQREYAGDTGVDAAKAFRKLRVDKHLVLYRANGCADCDKTGYKGRTGVYELMVADAKLKHLIQTRAPVAEIAAAAIAGGLRTLKQDGIAKVLQGLTDIRQVRGV